MTNVACGATILCDKRDIKHRQPHRRRRTADRGQGEGPQLHAPGICQHERASHCRGCCLRPAPRTGHSGTELQPRFSFITSYPQVERFYALITITSEFLYLINEKFPVRVKATI